MSSFLSFLEDISPFCEAADTLFWTSGDVSSGFQSKRVYSFKLQVDSSSSRTSCLNLYLWSNSDVAVTFAWTQKTLPRRENNWFITPWAQDPLTLRHLLCGGSANKQRAFAKFQDIAFVTDMLVSVPRTLIPAPVVRILMKLSSNDYTDLTVMRLGL